MMLDKQFLGRKTAAKELPNLFYFDNQEFYPVCALIKGQGRDWVAAKPAGRPSLAMFEDTSAPYEWGKSLDVIFVFRTWVASPEVSKHDPTIVPGQIITSEVHPAGDTKGPRFPVDIVAVARGQVPMVSKPLILAALRKAKSMTEADALGMDTFKLALPPFNKPSCVFALRVSFHFSIESADGRSMTARPGFKPFGDSAGQESYQYCLGLEAPESVGLREATILPLIDPRPFAKFLYFRMGRIPDNLFAGTAFAGDGASFVTESKYRESLEVEKF